jgi:hypothetical protein
MQTDFDAVTDRPGYVRFGDQIMRADEAFLWYRAARIDEASVFDRSDALARRLGGFPNLRYVLDRGRASTQLLIHVHIRLLAFMDPALDATPDAPLSDAAIQSAMAVTERWLDDRAGDAATPDELDAALARAGRECLVRFQTHRRHRSLR